ncbi:MAG: hypothetical protein H7281_03605 [Bacteriovorax sp.]|nr:hypothetical protein [Bacteriovorax sp.]
MPSRVDTNLKTVIDQFTPDILGVFWITNAELSRNLLGFDEFNYLFDGLISQYLYGQTKENSEIHPDRSNVFFTLNFNQKLFLAHLKMHSEIAGVLDDQIALLQENKNGDRKKILLFNQTQKNWGSDLQKRYPQFEFINLELSNI